MCLWPIGRPYPVMNMKLRIGGMYMGRPHMLTVIGALVVSLLPNNSNAKSFPGAIGFGAQTAGGRGGKVLFVTNLQDSGTGSLRSAIEQSGKRYVVFKVGGVINLKSQLIIKNPWITIAGQTAPGDGIVLKGAKLWIVTDEVIVRGMRFRPGDDSTGDPNYDNRDGISIGTTSRVTKNVIVDHNSISWSVDELVSFWGQASQVTVSNNIVGEALKSSKHPEGDHSMGMIIGTGDDTRYSGPDRITIARNLLVNSQYRCPLIKNVKNVEFINNYCFNFKHFVETGGPGYVHLIKNYFQVGTATSTARKPIHLLDESWSNYYLRGNLDSKYRTSSSQIETDIVSGSFSRIYSNTLFTPSGTPEIEVSNLLSYLVQNAGARLPKVDSVDKRLFSDVMNKNYRLINSISEVGGYPTYALGNAAADSDGDGIPDWFETANGFNSSIDDANIDSDGDGYTNIEEYLNGLIDDEAAFPSSGVGRFESENMYLSGFFVESNSAASNLKWIRTASSASTASAKFRYSGASGVYNLKVGYFDEADGISQMSIKVNGINIISWLWNENLGSNYANASTKREKTISSIALSPGDIIELTGKSDKDEPARLDYIDIVKP